MPTNAPSVLPVPSLPEPDPNWLQEQQHREDLKDQLRHQGCFVEGEHSDADYAFKDDLWAEIDRERAEERDEASRQKWLFDHNPLAQTRKPGVGEPLTEGRPWAIEGILTDQAMTLIAGKFKAGKSTLTTELAVSLATGTPMFGLDEFSTRIEPAPVLIIQTEDSQTRVDRDLAAILSARGLGPTEHSITVIDRQRPPTPRFNLLVQGHFDELLRCIASEGYTYVVLNPIYQLAGDVNISTWDNGPAITERLTQLRDAGCTPIITSALKASGRFDFDSVLGATNFAGWMETGILIQRAANERDFTIKVDVTRDRDRDGRATYKLRGHGVGRWQLQSATSGGDDTGETPKKRTTNFDKYREYIEANPGASKNTIAEALKLTTRTIERYIKEASTTAH